MNAPIFVLGCHRSGSSAVAGLLHQACGVSMGELMPPTGDNPMGYFEALGVVDAHRDLLAQMERDWTCPPSTFRPDLLDLSALKEQVDIHTKLPGVWAMKDPRSMFLLPAWSHLGVDRVRLIAVVRLPADTVKSIERRDHIRQDRAELIVEAYLGRLLEIARKVPLPVVHFPGDGDSLVGQVRDLAASLGLPWDQEAARAFFDESLVRNRSPLRDSSPTYDSLVQQARYPETVPEVSLRSLQLSSQPEWPLETHLGTRFGQHRNQLWDIAQFSADSEPDIVEVVPEGARPSRSNRPGVKLHRIEVKSPLPVGAALVRTVFHPHGVIVHGLLAGRSDTETEYLFRSLYISTDPFAELVVDGPDPSGEGLLSVAPPPIDHPRPARVQEIAAQCGWDHVVTQRLSPGRSGMFFRKRVLTDSELIPVVTNLIASVRKIHTIDERLSSIEDRLLQRGILNSNSSVQRREGRSSLEAEKKRADDAERALNRLRNRRSVRLALSISRPTRGVFRMVRSWKKTHWPRR